MVNKEYETNNPSVYKEIVIYILMKQVIRPNKVVKSSVHMNFWTVNGSSISWFENKEKRLLRFDDGVSCMIEMKYLQQFLAFSKYRGTGVLS